MKMSKLCSSFLKLAVVVAISGIAAYAGPDGHRHCPHSPENPSLILALLGTAGAAWQYLRRRAGL
jgi:hypothetical protein